MAETMTRSEVEYRFNTDISRASCPLCRSEFEPRLGSWPFLAGTSTPVCGGPDCPLGEDVTGPSPCDTHFEFGPLADATLDALEDESLQGETVAERLRRVALQESLPDPDRAMLQLAGIDLRAELLVVAAVPLRPVIADSSAWLSIVGMLAP